MNQIALEALQPINRPHFPEDPLFRVKQSDLISCDDVATIELRETVHDPLGAAPARPFGFLYPVWLQFRKGFTDDTKLWLFKASVKISYHVREIRIGYVEANSSAVEWHFVTQVVDLP